MIVRVTRRAEDTLTQITHGLSDHVSMPKVVKGCPFSSITVTPQKWLHLSEVIGGCRKSKAAAFRIARMNVS